MIRLLLSTRKKFQVYFFKKLDYTQGKPWDFFLYDIFTLRYVSVNPKLTLISKAVKADFIPNLRCATVCRTFTGQWAINPISCAHLKQGGGDLKELSSYSEEEK